MLNADMRAARDPRAVPGVAEREPGVQVWMRPAARARHREATCAPRVARLDPIEPNSAKEHGERVLCSRKWRKPVANAALDSYRGRSDLHPYGDNGLLLFALQLYFKLDDIVTVATTALTDGPNDKNCDLVYFDTDTSCVVVAQGYMSSKKNAEAKASKASDLNTAVSWIIDGELDEMPLSLQSAALEVRQALEADRVQTFEIWYVHNLDHSENVARELRRVEHTAKHLLGKYGNAQVGSIAAREVGRDRLDEWYRRTEVPIVVSTGFEVPVFGGFWEKSDEWSAFCATIPVSWLYDQWQKYGADLFSPNVRDYLGLRRSERNINYGIQKTARENPEQFWIFNNGVTIIVNDMQHDVSRSELHIEGLGIVNGAQTTGTIGSLGQDERAHLDKVRIMARFVKCSDPDILRDVVRFNNTQNKVEAADFRSNDEVQERLRKEFELIPEAEYRGARRGSARDVIERKRNLLPDKTVAQSLAAFHGQPNLAYNDTRRIWVDDSIYSQYFSSGTTARHIIFCASLLRAIERSKESISLVPEVQRTDVQRGNMDYFRRRGVSIHG